MTKTRTILGVLMLLFMVAGAFVWGSGFMLQNKVLLSIPLALFYLAAGILFLVTLFSLDEQGRVPRNSFFYWMLKNSTSGPVSDTIKLCPSFWTIVFYLLVAAVGLFMVWACSYLLILSGIYVFSHWADISFAGFLLVLKDILITVGTLICTIGVAVFLINRKQKFLQWFGTLYLLSAVIFGLALLVMNLHHWTFWHAVAYIAMVAGIAGIIVGVLAIAMLVIFGFIALMSTMAPWIKNTAVGIVISALYEKMCPLIPVEPASKQ